IPMGCGSSIVLPGADVEPNIAIDPRHPNRIVAGWMDGNAITPVVATSRDGGRHWGVARLPGFNCTGDPAARLSGDVSPTVGPDGRAYVSALSDVGENDPLEEVRHIKVLALAAPAVGRSWGPPVQVQGPDVLNDRATITADPRAP